MGLDRIPARLLKDSADIVVKPVTFITAKVPCDWKSARVIPLFKKGKTDEMDNYRPISILPVLSKVLERAVHIQLYKYLQHRASAKQDLEPLSVRVSEVSLDRIRCS